MEKAICKRCGKVYDKIGYSEYCWDCLKQVNLERSQESVKDPEEYGGIDTYSDDYVICPYCGNAIDVHDYDQTLDLDDLWEDGDKEYTCEKCGKTYTCTTNVSYTFETERIDDELSD